MISGSDAHGRKAVASAQEPNGRHEAAIYCLRCPHSGLARYIGKAIDPEKRLHSHLRDAATGKTRFHHGNWLRQLLANGERPQLQVLLQVGDFRWHDIERFCIAAARHFGFQLTNATEGGEGLRLCDEEQGQAVRLALQRAWERTRESRSAAIRAEARSEAGIARRRDIQGRPEVRAKTSSTMRAYCADEDARARLTAISREAVKRPDVIAAKSAASKKMWADPERAARQRAAISAGKFAGWARRKAAAQQKTGD